MPVAPSASVLQLCFGVVLLTVTAPVLAVAEDQPGWNTLSGNWGGLRSTMYHNGLIVELTHKSDWLDSNGGIAHGSGWLRHTEFRASIDLDKMLGWTSTLAYLHYNIDSGSKINLDYAGSFSGVDNIEVQLGCAGLFQAWGQKNFFSDGLSLLAGLYPVDSEFYVTESSSVFVHPSYGMSAEIAQPANNGRIAHGPSIFNISTFGIRARYSSPNRTAYLLVSVNDAVPGDVNNACSTHFYYDREDGRFVIAELGYTPLEAGHNMDPVAPEVAARMDPLVLLHEKYETIFKVSLGAWHYTGQYNDLSDVDQYGSPMRRPRQGMYVLAERTLFWERDDPAQGVAGFIRYGSANPDVHQADWSGSIGLRYRGLLNGRDDDIAGLAVTISHASDKYRSLTLAAYAETVTEATYRIQIVPWFALQPLLQYIQHPNMDPTLDNVRVAGIRAEAYI